MKKIHIILKDGYEEFRTFIGAFSSLKKANSECEKLRKSTIDYMYYVETVVIS